ncbi:MAG: cytochrome b/b6 domain-containing protein [Gammaproteobacteria bacterium]|nr:cytochrome b/b6 domain-containing protein [Gammaproteobacteria bacterium]
MASQRYPLIIRSIHLGLIIFGISAFLTGEFAEDEAATLGYLAHTYLGLALTLFVVSRTAIGIVGPKPSRFATWFPFTRARFSVVLEDIKKIFKLELPVHDGHQGISALVHAFGILLFLWMGLTGTALYFIGDFEASMAGKFVAEIHEVGESLIPLFLVLHVGAVILHTVLGHPILKRMLSFGRVKDQERVNDDGQRQN